MSSGVEHRGWTFVTNHTRVLLCIASNSDARLRDVAEEVGITERAVQRIVRDLADAGFLQRERIGRRNRYVINRKGAMRHPAQIGHQVGALLDLLKPETPAREAV